MNKMEIQLSNQPIYTRREICSLAEAGCLGAKHPKLFEIVCSSELSNECNYKLTGTPITDEKLCSAYNRGCSHAESPITFIHCCIRSERDCLGDYFDNVLGRKG